MTAAPAPPPLAQLVRAAALPEFRYDHLAPAERAWLEGRRDALRGKVAETARRLVEVGAILLEVRQRLGKKRFAKWRAAETPFSRDRAKRLMAVARSFAGMGQIDLFAPSALYVLAWPSVPPAARAAAIAEAKSGRAVTHAGAQALLKTYRRPAPAEQARAARESARAFEEFQQAARALGAGAAGPRPAAGPAEAARELQAAAWRNLLRLVADCGMVKIDRLPDAEFADPKAGRFGAGRDGDVLYDVTAYPDAGGEPVRKAVGADLALAVADAAGAAEPKECRRCKGRKPRAQFNRSRSQADGRAAWCRDCEKEKDRAKKQKQAAAKQAAGSATAGPPPPGA